ncbi:hypothetical protein R6Q59_035380 [Mikania micrantha]|uniref:Uncharacterized protein n=1 Tax=Mikania micrantha TaxID=192012 RepID=A0A5N6NEQ1_9ASTR|nr:hypothetical protein E3N88_23885 [Mikania micrantha]
MRNTYKTHEKKPVTIVRIIKTPLRAISKALHLYVKCVSNFSDTYHKPLRTIEITPNRQPFPRSFSTSCILSNNQQPPEGALVRSISTAVNGRNDTQIKISELELYMIQHQHQQLQSFASSKGHVPRSFSVGMKKIDEDRVCSFRDDHIDLTLQSKLSFKDKDSVFSRS